MRIDESSARWGNLSAYYFFDDYAVTNPFPSGQGGATVPGFSGLNYGRAQLLSLGDTRTFGSSTVNELHFSYMRNANVVGQPEGGLGISVASQGFNIGNGAGSPGLVPLAPFEGVENIVFAGSSSFVMGTPITNLGQSNNTFSANESLSRIVRNHTLKAGVQVSFEQVNVHPDATLNGTFIFNGYQTGNNFADYLIGAPIQFEQADSEAYYPRHKYVGWYAQDSWRVKPSLTLNYGLRVELMQYWAEKYDQVPTFNPGEQSVGISQLVSRLGLSHRSRHPQHSRAPAFSICSAHRFGVFAQQGQRPIGKDLWAEPERPAFAPATAFSTP